MSQSQQPEQQASTTPVNQDKKNLEQKHAESVFEHNPSGVKSFSPPDTPLQAAARQLNNRPKSDLEISAAKLGANPPLTQLQKSAMALGKNPPKSPFHDAIQMLKSQVKPSPFQMKSGASTTEATSVNSNSNGLPDAVKTKMEGAFNTDFSGVKIHDNSTQAKNIGALAYTQGKDIHFAPGQYNPDSTSGQELIGHELTHVVQQSQGRVKATTQAKGIPVNDDPELEREADEMGRKAASITVDQTAQRKAAKSLKRTGDNAPVQRFEAPLHESASRNALTENGDFSQEEASMIYYGNWMRDVNQAFVPAAMEMLGADTLYAMLNYVALQKFGKAPTSEQMGYYMLQEHLDSPVGAIKGSEYSESAPKITENLENQSYINPEGASPTSAKNKTQQLSITPTADAIPGQSLGIFEVDSTGVMGYIRRTNLHVEKRLQEAAEKGRNEEGFLHFGAAMHAVEDLFAHSNYVEIAVEEMLNGDLHDYFSDLRDTNKKISIQSFAPEVEVPVGRTGRDKRSVLATGSFSSVDTMESVGHEIVHILRQPPKEPQSLVEMQAQNQFIENLAKQMDTGLSSADSEEILSDILGENLAKVAKYFGKINGLETLITTNNRAMEWIWKHYPEDAKQLSYKISLIVHQNAMLPLADQIDSLVLETNVAHSSMVSVLESNKRIVENEGKLNDYIQPQLNKVDTKGDIRAARLDEAKKRVGVLEATPEQAVAGPSHSQISKDHKNSVFFGLGFQLAVAADKKLKDQMLKVWGNKKVDISYNDGLEDKRKEDAEKNLQEGKYVLEHGYAEGVKPDLAGAKKEAADSLREVSVLMVKLDKSPTEVQKYLNDKHDLIKESELLGTNTYLTEKIDDIFNATDSNLNIVDQNVRPLELQAAAEQLKDLAVQVEAAKSLEDREKLYAHMTSMRSQFVKYLVTQQSQPGFATHKMSYAAVLTAMDRAVAFNAPSYTSHQKNILEGTEHINGIPAHLRGNLTVNEGFKPSRILNSNSEIEGLLKTSREIITHPKENDWWKSIVKQYITSNKNTVKDYIMARNMGFATLRDTDTH